MCRVSLTEIINPGVWNLLSFICVSTDDIMVEDKLSMLVSIINQWVTMMTLFFFGGEGAIQNNHDNDILFQQPPNQITL